MITKCQQDETESISDFFGKKKWSLRHTPWLGVFQITGTEVETFGVLKTPKVKKGAAAETAPQPKTLQEWAAKNKNGNLFLEKTRARGWFMLMNSWKGDAENPYQSRQTTRNGFPVFDLLKNRASYE
ncbi:hypothetical protein [Algoriphagus winogradskyi]|uniref:Uncharacterized protein n=1 Tax=Algoriphagus winogradskyi TaxID=237017 RepID=A0ABY1NVX5_9BACT|nr:hypothetical protein [Algoriphagus winogradskyi]SMP19475.1 hypothetical protein SAMN06265367_1037 [Algoriphagus winogradskyi]